MNQIFSANLVSLSSRSPEAARLVGQAATESLAELTAATGLPVLECAGRALDSRRDPVRSATTQAAGVTAARVVLAGFGGGYLPEALLAAGIDVTAIVIDRLDVLAAAMRARDLRVLLEQVPVVPLDSLRDPVDIAVLRARARDLVSHAPSLADSVDLRTLAARWHTIQVAERPPRVIVVGPIAGGSQPAAESTAAAMASCGADVTFFDAAEFGDAYRALGRYGAIPHHRPYRQGRLAQLIGDAVVDVATEGQADLVLALAQAPLHPAALARIREAGITTAFWFVENSRVLTYWRDLAPAYDWFYGIQPGEFLERLSAAGSTHPGYLPMACDPSRHRAVVLDPEERERFASDVSFAGAPYLNRRHVLAGLTDFALRIWGPGWTDPALAPFVAQAGRFSLDEMVRIFAGSRINLNLHSAAHVTGVDPQPDYVNPRTFELASCRAFQLVDRRDPLPTLFDEGDLATFSNLDELRTRIAHYLTADDERAVMVARAHARVLRDHTYGHRIRQILRDTLPVALAAAALAGVRRGTLVDAIAARETEPLLTRDELLLRMARELQRSQVTGGQHVLQSPETARTAS